jgi:putative ABC transport system permease protein
LLLAAAVGSAPALDLARGSLAQRARRTPGRLATSQRGIIGIQIAVATIVLAVAALFGEALVRTTLGDGGFDPRNVTVVQIRSAGGENPDDAAAVLEFRRMARERLLAIAEIDSVGFGQVVPSVLGPSTYAVRPLGGFRDEIASRVARLGADWMEVLGVRVLRGHLPEATDRDAAVVSRRFAEAVWGTLDVLGERMLAPTDFSAAGGAGATAALIVTAVVEDVQFANPADLPRPAVFVNQPIRHDLDGFVLLKGSLGARDAEAALSEVLAEVTPRMEIMRAFPLEQSLAALLAPDRSRTKLTALAGALTALLAALGFFGALRFMVDDGRFELALRSALGAEPGELRNHVIRRGLRLGLPGLAAGLILSAAALSRVREAFEIYHTGVLPALVSCAAIVLVLMGVAIGLPAIRASRLEPSAVLNEQ